MKNSFILKQNILFLCFLLAISIIIIVGEAAAETYYIAADGHDNNIGSANSPWATFSYAVGQLGAGDTLYIKNGTYYQSLNITKSGTSGNPITVKALNDGQAIIDGQGVRWACAIIDQKYVDVEGIICRDSSEDVFKITRSDYINLKRVSAYDGSNENYVAFSIYIANYILLEDTAASGTGRKQYNIQTTDHVTVRRCWGRWKQYIAVNPNIDALAVLELYNSTNTIVENCVGTSAVLSTGQIPHGIGIVDSTKGSSNNSIYGNVMYDLPGGAYTIWGVNTTEPLQSNNYYSNNVGINSKEGFQPQQGDRLIAENFTIVNAFSSSTGAVLCGTSSSFPMHRVDLTLKNSVLIDSERGINANTRCDNLKNTYNDTYNNTYNYYGNTSQGTGEITIKPTYDTVTFGKGAYLIRPSNLKTSGEGGTYMGAEVLYRYKNGKLTDVPLWPWPMEERICNETGYSVTYENGCTKGGGLWKTLDGLYSSSSTPSPTIFQCSDGIDNDKDGQTDYPNDPGCSSASDNDELNALIPLQTAPSSELIGYWTMDSDLINNNVITDSSGNNLNGLIINDPVKTIGQIGGALLFDGINDYVKVSNLQFLSGSNELTISAWFNPIATPITNGDNDAIIMQHDNWNNQFGIRYDGNGKELVAIVQNNSAAAFVTVPNSEISSSAWHYVTMTFRNGVVELYLDGNFKGRSDKYSYFTTLPAFTNNILIGSLNNISSNYFNGLIDDVKFYNRALNSDEASALYRKSDNIAPAPPTDLRFSFLTY